MLLCKEAKHLYFFLNNFPAKGLQKNIHSAVFGVQMGVIITGTNINIDSIVELPALMLLDLLYMFLCISYCVFVSCIHIHPRLLGSLSCLQEAVECMHLVTARPL